MIAAIRKASYLSNKTKEMAVKDGAIAFFSMNPLGKDGTVFVTGGGSYKPKDPENLLDIALAAEDYLTLCRLAKAGIPVKLDGCENEILFR
ncbi:MAG: hypothetical protein IPH28_16920 [Cytophagaceae bacterium]|nr:hypothetical protein [Cytophagaceae bacterium]